MTALTKLIKDEPVALVGVLTALVALATVMGWVTQDQAAAISAVIAAVTAFARQAVTPNTKVPPPKVVLVPVQAGSDVSPVAGS